jgi:hypothetical protein
MGGLLTQDFRPFRKGLGKSRSFNIAEMAGCQMSDRNGQGHHVGGVHPGARPPRVTPAPTRRQRAGELRQAVAMVLPERGCATHVVWLTT